MEHRRVSDKGLSFITSVLELALQVVSFLALTVAVSCLLIPASEYNVKNCFLIVIPVVAGYFARKYIRKFAPFVLIHIIFVVASIAVSNSDVEIVYNIISTAVYMAYSIKLKNRAILLGEMSVASRTLMDDEAEKEAALRSLAEGEKIPLYFAVCMIVGSLAATVNANAVALELEIELCIIFVILQVVYDNYSNLYQVFRINKDKSNFPAMQIKKVTGFVTIVSCVLILLGMFLFYSGEYGNIFTIVSKAFMWLVKLLAKLLILFIGAFGKESTNRPVEETTAEAVEDESVPSIFEEAEGSAFMEALAEIIGAVLIIACIIGIIYLFREYIKNFNMAKNVGTDIIENVKPVEKVEKAEKIVTVKSYKETKTEKNVRKIYKKLVLKGNKGKAPECSHTPDRLTTDNITQDEKLAKEITYIYEKARYSTQPVSKEDVEKMKQL